MVDTDDVPLASAGRSQVEAELRLKDGAFASSLAGIAIHDLAGNFVYVNPAYARMHGFGPAEMIGKPVVAFFPEQGPEVLEAVMGDGVWTGERVAVRKDGTRFFVHGSVSLIRKERGEPLAVVASFIDVTAQKQVEAEQRFKNLLLKTQQEVSPDGILVVSEDGKVVSYNRRFVDIWEIPPEVVATGSDDRLLESVMDKLAEPEEFLGKVRYLYGHPGEESRDEIDFRDGRTLDRYSAPLMSDGGTYFGRIWYFRDITDRKQAERMLAKRSEELERSNRDLEQFAYVASHDLQEPLRMVSSYTQLLAERYRGKFDEDANDFIDFAVGGARRMQQLIHDLLLISRVGRGRTCAAVDAGVALRQALANLAVAVEDSHAVVTHDELPTVGADATQLVQLFQNLIGNAIKFRSDQAPTVHVGVRGEADEWVFSVCDNGIGIDPKYHGRLFQIFQRLHGKEVSGNGIGLALCLRIVQGHGGRIWIESEAGKGSTFCFSWPR